MSTLRSNLITLYTLPSGQVAYPGINDLPVDPAWAESNAGFRGALAAGWIELLDGEPTAPADPAAEAALGFNPQGVTFAQAKTAIADETDVAALRAWRNVEKRKSIVGLLDARLLALDPPKAED